MFRGFISLCPSLVVMALVNSLAAQETTFKLVGPPVFVGGSRDDQRFAGYALAFRVNQDVNAERLRIGLMAVRETDRFRSVEGRFEDADGGKIVILELDPWPVIKTVHTDIPAEIKKNLKPWLQDMRKGTRPGEIAIANWKKRVGEWLPVWGYPSAEVNVSRSDKGDALTISISLGKPMLLRQIEISGELGSIRRESILKDLGVNPGRVFWKKAEPKEQGAVAWIAETSERLVWTREAKQKAIHRLNRRFGKYKYFMAKVDFFEPEDGKFKLDISSGPTVNLSSKGIRLSKSKMKEYLDLPAIDRQGSDFLGEAERRLTSRFQSEGRPFVKTSLTEKPIAGKSDSKTIRLECSVEDARILHVSDIKIKGNVELKESDLLQAARINFEGFFSAKPKAVPEFAENSMEHVLSYCLSKGYANARVWADWQMENNRINLLITVSEGNYQELKELIFDFETSNQTTINLIKNGVDEFIRNGKLDKTGYPYIESDPRYAVWKTIAGRWEHTDNNSVHRLIINDKVPFIKVYIADIRSTVQQILASTGVLNPVVNIDVSTVGKNGIVVRLKIPEQPAERIRRFIIQGVEHTSAEFIRTEIRPGRSTGSGRSIDSDHNRKGINFGQPYVISSIVSARTNLGSTGIFNAIDIRSMKEKTEDETADTAHWQPGDILLHLRERPLWNFSNSFSYDKSVGYQFGTGIQRLNIGGRAKTLDFSIRAGDGTIGNPTLRDFFPTGNPGRSLDVYSIGYSDPWLSTKALSELFGISDRSLLLGNLAYIRERQGAYLIFRRRFTSSIEWRLRDVKRDIQTLRFGYRFENVGIDGPDAEEMQYVVGSPERSMLSVPYIQFIRDTRDHAFDPKRGGLISMQLEAALQGLGTSDNSSFVKADFRTSWNFPMGRDARFGVTSLAVRFGLARPTASSSLEMPLSERFFAGGPNSHRGIEPDQLGPFGEIKQRRMTFPYDVIVDKDGAPSKQTISTGGQGIALVNLDYRFPLPFLGQWIWGELFVDSGEVYNRIREYKTKESQLPPFPHWRTSVGVGLVLRLGGFPIKIEYSWDARKILGKEDNEVYGEYVERTRLKNLLVSAGIQF